MANSVLPARRLSKNHSKGYDFRFANIEHVSGACQLFRRECFEDIGGYKPVRGGGIDWIAVTTARMKGWQTRTFTEKTCLHHRKMGTGNVSAIMTWFRQGKKDYFLGNHPLWEVFRTIYQMTKKPVIIGGALLMLGFTWSAITRMSEANFGGTSKIYSPGTDEKAERIFKTNNLKHIAIPAQPVLESIGRGAGI